jgi:hypothetical protein
MLLAVCCEVQEAVRFGMVVCCWCVLLGYVPSNRSGTVSSSRSQKHVPSIQRAF